MDVWIGMRGFWMDIDGSIDMDVWIWMHGYGWIAKEA